MRRVGPNQLQAAIAALHDDAAAADETDWAQIAGLYAVLGRVAPSPVVELNRAVAVAMASGPELGLRLVDAVAASGQLEEYPYLHAARADLLRRLGRLVGGGRRLHAGPRADRERGGAGVPGSAAGRGGRRADDSGGAAADRPAGEGLGVRSGACRSGSPRRLRAAGSRPAASAPGTGWSSRCSPGRALGPGVVTADYADGRSPRMERFDPEMPWKKARSRGSCRCCRGSARSRDRSWSWPGRCCRRASSSGSGSTSVRRSRSSARRCSIAGGWTCQTLAAAGTGQPPTARRRVSTATT